MTTPSQSGSPLRAQRSLIYEWAMIAAAVTLIAFVLVAGSWTSKLDDALYDGGLSLLRHPTRDDVLIVAIDEETISAKSASDGSWPWRHSDIAELLKLIAAGNPKAVGVDMMFAELNSQDPDEDNKLRQALNDIPNVVLPVLSAHGRQMKPMQSIAGNTRLGQVSLTPDTDGILRRVVLVSGAAGEYLPNMAVAMIQAAGARMPTTLDWGDYLIPFAGPPGTINHVSAAALLRGEVSPSVVANKFILVGVKGNKFADSYATPPTSMINGARMSSVEVTANILNALLDKQSFSQLGKYPVGMVSALAILILLLVFYRVGPTVSVFLMLVTAILTPALAIASLGKFGVWFPPMSVAISALVAYPLWSWKRLEAICHNLDDEIVQLEKDTEGAPRVLPAGTVGFADYIQNRVELIRLNVNYLRAARKFLSESLDGLPNAALVVAPSGQLVVANRQALDLCHLNKTELTGRGVDEALVRITLEQSDWLRAVSSALAGNALELKGSDANGSEYEIAMASFHNDQSVVSGLIVVIEDVTQLRQAQREREEALSFLSHDIRSPQNSIMALAELQRHEGMRKPETDFVSSVEALAKKTVDLAEDFLQLVRADSKPLKLAEYDFAALLEDCVAEIEPQAKAKQIDIRFAQPAGRVSINADRSLLTRAIGNLLVNAIKYTPAGSRVVASCDISNNKAVCNIVDNGPGIAEEDLPNLFKRFTRGQGVDSKVAGAGLGLAFVDVVAKRHDGQAQVRSTLGRGATFSIILPLLVYATGTDGEFA